MPASPIDPSLLQLVRQSQPAELSAGCFFPLSGLSHHSFKIVLPQQNLLARRQPRLPIPFVDRRREYRVLKKLSAGGMVKRPVGYNQHWLLLSWQPGETLSSQEFAEYLRPVCRALVHLHHQPLTGYRLSLTALLEKYWQLCRQKTHHWLQFWQRLKSQGEPLPLRLVPIHMDIHAGNVVKDSQCCRFIDWEYTADGDIALDLAVICLNDSANETQWIDYYAGIAGLTPERLARQVNRWKPWLKLLMACWYQLRAEQTASPQMQTLARQYWQNLSF
ncbi:hypothetical protein HA49_10615 [Tatumella morbirosei]|uniref:Thiamine kinase n=1 Tax=Tatumella morbirosei TaxID=642227 RepID=A0A095UGX6_9GAMM|nr:thiamine kinase [Tatumella morbirosei]KGD73693.1 hypothetical protein HA49_10615 [Tatumella morbirosei]